MLKVCEPMGDDSEISNHELGGNKIKGILFIYLIKDILNEQMKIVNHTHRYGKTDGWLPEVMGGVWISWCWENFYSFKPSNM